MNGFEGNYTSRAKWTTDFRDNQIFKVNDGKPWIDHGYAGWEIDIDVSYKDSGNKVNTQHQSQTKLYYLNLENLMQLSTGVLCKSN